MIFDFTAYDGNTGLDVAGLVYDINGGSPTLVDTVTMAHVANGSYYGAYTTDDTKEYLIQVAAYTDGTFTTRHTDYTPGSITVQKSGIAAIKAAVDAIPTNPLLDDDARLDYLDVAISSRLASSDFVAPANSDITAIRAVTDTFTFSGGGVVASVIDSQLDIKKNADFDNFPFPMSDNITNAPKTGVLVTAEVSIDGGAFAACTNSVSEISDGMYKINLAAADLNGDSIILKFTATDAFQRTISLFPRS